jgi:hypothetical protein
MRSHGSAQVVNRKCVQHIDAGLCALLECLQDSLAAAVVTEIALVIGADIAGRVRPKAVTHHNELVATKRPSVAWGKLTPMFRNSFTAELQIGAARRSQAICVD